MGKVKTTFKILTLTGLTCFVSVGTIGTLVATKWISESPTISKQMLSSDSSSKMYDNSDNIIWQSSEKPREYIKYSELSKAYINALTSVENRSFFTDKGFSVKSVTSAVVGNILHVGASSDGTVRGGSTITQQLIKLTAYGTGVKYQTAKRKVQEMYLSYNLTKTYSKKQILEFYVNKLYEGHRIYGIQTISKYYYGKSLKDLDLSQTAILAGIGQSPAVYDLYGSDKTLKLVTDRRNVVLKSMLDNHKITTSEYKSAVSEDIKTGLIPANQKIIETEKVTRQDQAYIMSALNQVKSLGYDYTQDGLQIHTGLNQKMQDIVTDKLTHSTAYQGMEGVQSAVTITQPNTGYVMAQVGGRNLGDSLYGINRATQTSRSSGSGIKPLIDYGPAIQYLNWPTNHTLADTPYIYAGTNIQLYDFDRNYLGNMTMKQALITSRNVPAVRALDAVGGSRASSFLDKLNLPNNGANTGGSDGIGINASTAQMAAAYGAVANNGKMNTTRYVHKVVLPNGSVEQTPTHEVQAMSEGTAYSLISMMKDVFKKNASGPNAEISGLAQAGKTGTVGYDASVNVPSGAVSDSWVNGFIKGASVSMWTGYDFPNQNYIPASLELNDQTVYKEIMNEVKGMVDTSDWQATGVTDLGNGYFQKSDTKVLTTGVVPTQSLHPNVDGTITQLQSVQKAVTYLGKNKSKTKTASILKKYSTPKWTIPTISKDDEHLLDQDGDE